MPSRMTVASVLIITLCTIFIPFLSLMYLHLTGFNNFLPAAFGVVNRKASLEYLYK